MFKATRPFKDSVTGYDKEPSLRIGKKVPDNAVNLAYYFNPTATDAEKILASDPPRQTIDHRIETQWLTKTDQASGPNGEEPSIDLFPKAIYYSDEEGYYGRLKRQDETVKWYPEQHIDQKGIDYDNVQIVTQKGDEDKVIEYSDADGYKGNLYLDTTSYEAYTTVDASVVEEMDYSINNFELNYYEIFGTYLNSEEINNGPWMQEPNPISGSTTCWPARIELTPTQLLCTDSGVHNKIANYVNNLDNDWEGANEQFINNPNIISTSKPIGFLYFDKLEYQPVKYKVPPTSSTVSQERKIEGIVTDSFNWEVEADLQEYENQIPTIDKITINGDPIKTSYTVTSSDYSDVYEFIALLNSISTRSYSAAIRILEDAIDKGKGISIWLSDLRFIVDDESIDMLVDGSNVSGHKENEIDAIQDPSSCHFEADYKYVVTDKGTEGNVLYNVIATYHTTYSASDGKESVTRTIITNKEEATSYRAYCHYSGLANKNWVDYDGIAYYMGSVTKGNSIGNQNANDDNEILMFPDENGLLRQIVEGIKTETDEDNRQVYSTEYRNYYRVEADSIYLTDVFKDNEACFYRYRLKQPIYDYRGPDDNGFYQGDAVQVFTSTLKDIPDTYKHNMKLEVAQYEEHTSYDKYNNPITVSLPKCYYADLFTSFISSSTDTFKVVYNGFNDIDDDNKIIENGIEEDIYNAPYMIEGVDYELQLVDKKARLNRIKLINYSPLEDQRLRITFKWKVVAVDKDNNKTFYSETRQSSILNKDYCIPCEYKDFEDRAMIISPKLNGDSIPCSPRDLCLHDQAGYQSLDDSYQPVISDTDTGFIYSVEIEEIYSPGSVNIKCNPDGSGYITAETTVDTGFYDELRASYTKKLNLDNPYWTDGKYIYKGYKVKCIDSRTIKVKAPREERLLDSWYPMIQFGHYSRVMDQYGAHTKVCYSMPEYDTQHYSDIYGQPYVDITNEKLTILNSHMVKTLCYPLYVLYDNNNIPGTVHVFKKIGDETFELTIRDISFSDGVIVIKESISENDNIIASYTYLEENYNYRGYWRDVADFVRIDLNPNIYHTYNNPNYLPSEVSPSKNLFNKVIYFFMKPSIEYSISAENDSLVYDPENDSLDGEIVFENDDCLYHKIDIPEPDSDMDIMLGSVYIRQNTSLYSTVITDSRTRGGGILESISDSLRHELEPESDFYLDIGFYDGKPYQENGVIVVRIDNRILKEFGGRFTAGDVEQKVKRWLGLGVYPIIEFVDSYKKEDLPQYTLEIEDNYTNVIDITPVIYCESRYSKTTEEYYEEINEKIDNPPEQENNIPTEEEQRIEHTLQDNDISYSEDDLYIVFEAETESGE